MSILFKSHDHYPEAILVRTFYGQILPEEMISSWNELLDSNLITTNTLGIINDLSHCELKMDIDKFKEFTTFLKSKPQLEKLKLAVVTNSPKNIVFPILGESQESTLHIKPFSTFRAATHWIMNG
jgi:hypothetical protein